jgi:hypothetical protein
VKTKELIRQLQKADPSGEIECCIGNADILFVDIMEAYWDGRLQTLIRDKNGKAIGVKVTSNGMKIKIHDYSIKDVLLDNPDAEVILDLEGKMLSDYQERVDRLRKEYKGIWEKILKDEKEEKNNENSKQTS